MKRTIFLILSVLLLAVRADAYTQARVYINASVKGNSTEGEMLKQILLGRITSQLVPHYTCLSIMDTVTMNQMLGFIKSQQLAGTEGAYSQLDDLLGMMDMKYLISVEVAANKDTGLYILNIKAQNKKKREFPFYTDSTIFRSYGAALAGFDGMVEALIKGFTKYLSDEREWAGGEICPMKGPVTVTVETERMQNPPEEVLYKHCNGDDRQWKKSSSLKATSTQVWKLERKGIPDTEGTMEGSSYEESSVEETDGCHECSNGKRQDWWSYSEKTRTTHTVSGLSEASATAEFPTKDATITLHFNEDGTYDITVAATSTKGKMLSSWEVAAEGSCDVQHKNKKVSSTFTIPMQYTFTGFPGTPYDTVLKGKKTLKFEDKEKEEKTTVTIDFDLSRPTINK